MKEKHDVYISNEKVSCLESINSFLTVCVIDVFKDKHIIYNM